MITGVIASGLFGIGNSLIERLFPNPEAQAKAKLELLAMQQAGELKELEIGMSAIVAEAQSNDPWTSRARPSFLYVFYAVILMLTIVAPMLGIFFPGAMEQFFGNVAVGFAALPEELWWTFSVGYLGYSGVRTYEKSHRKT
jgi:hypothetical protein